MKRLKIAYITSTDPKNKHSWSGTAHYVWKALEKNIGEIDLLGPAEPKFILFLAKIFQAFSIYVCGKRFDFRHSSMISKAYARIFEKKLQGKNYDLIVAPGGTAYTAYLKTNIPVVLILDRTLGNALNYHSVLSHLWAFSKEQSLLTDKTAMEKAAHIFFSSEWAADHARTEYKIDPKKIKVVPFGANLDEVPSGKFILENKKTGGCKLLFIGTNWKFKGADIAVNTLNKLISMGIDAHLTIVGCTPTNEFTNKNVSIIPFVNKNTADGKKQMEELFLSHNFFILPTRFEAFGIVFCEASAYGLICLGSNTGGVPGVVKENVNGFLIDLNDDGTIYAQKIKELFGDKNRMKQLSESVRNFYEAKLNWDSWAKEISESFATMPLH